MSLEWMLLLIGICIGSSYTWGVCMELRGLPRRMKELEEDVSSLKQGLLTMDLVKENIRVREVARVLLGERGPEWSVAEAEPNGRPEA